MEGNGYTSRKIQLFMEPPGDRVDFPINGYDFAVPLVPDKKGEVTDSVYIDAQRYVHLFPQKGMERLPISTNGRGVTNMVVIGLRDGKITAEYY